MLKLPPNRTHLTWQQNNAQNSPSQASAVCEPRTSRCSSWIRRGRGTRDQIANIRWITEKARELQKNIYFCFIDYTKAFDSVDHNKLWKILKEMRIPDHLTSLLRNLYVGQAATVRTVHGTMDWVPNWERSTSRLYIDTLLIYLICRVRHETCWAGWITSWNQDCREKFQQPQIQRFLGGADGKESACNAGDLCSIPGSGRLPGGGNANQLQYSCLESHGQRSLVGYSP